MFLHKWDAPVSDGATSAPEPLRCKDLTELW